MNVVRIVQGKLFFDEFDNTTLDPKWSLVPNDSLRYSLIERPGFLKLFHNTPDLFALVDEPDTYILDISNEYVPLSDQVQAGLVVFKSLDEKLEVLEYYDATKDSSIVYQYLRLEKSGNVYTAYGKNNDLSEWELVGSGEFKSAGKVGLIIKGPAIQGSSDYNIDYFRMYLTHLVEIVNIPAGYTVELLDANDNPLGAQKVLNPNSGVKFSTDLIPPYTAYFKVFDTTGALVTTSARFSMCGGDIYYYGAVPLISIDGNDVYQDSEYFLGYFGGGEIPFTLTITNPYPEEFLQLTITAKQYETDPGYQCVWFCDTIDGTYSQSFTIPSIASGATVSLYGKVIRDENVLLKLDSTPFKFNLSLGY